MAEEAFELVSPNLTDGIDNIALLKLDIVWYAFSRTDPCMQISPPSNILGIADRPKQGRSPFAQACRRCFFQLQDSSKLAAASERLAAARKALRASHGPDLARLRVLHGEFRPELALCAAYLSRSYSCDMMIVQFSVLDTLMQFQAPFNGSSRFCFIHSTQLSASNDEP